MTHKQARRVKDRKHGRAMRELGYERAGKKWARPTEEREPELRATFRARPKS